jgi:hypothetical protein
MLQIYPEDLLGTNQYPRDVDALTARIVRGMGNVDHSVGLLAVDDGLVPAGALVAPGRAQSAAILVYQ